MLSGIASAVGMGSTPECLCKNGHPMEEQDVEAGWSSYGCDYCGVSGEEAGIEERFRCVENCNFDLCASCMKFQDQLPLRAEAVFPKGKLIFKWYAANQNCGKSTTIAELGEADGVNYNVNTQESADADDKLFWCYGYRGADNGDTNSLDDKALPFDRDGKFWNILDKDIICTSTSNTDESPNEMTAKLEKVDWVEDGHDLVTLQEVPEPWGCKKGYLTKKPAKGGITGGFSKKRWFEFRRGELKYFDKEGGTEKGCIEGGADAFRMHAVELLDGLPGAEEGGANSCDFKIFQDKEWKLKQERKIAEAKRRKEEMARKRRAKYLPDMPSMPVSSSSSSSSSCSSCLFLSLLQLLFFLTHLYSLSPFFSPQLSGHAFRRHA